MKERFSGREGRRRVVNALSANRLVCHERPLAEALADLVTIEQVVGGQAIIVEGAADNDLFFILTGCFAITVRGTFKSSRPAGSHVGEMSAINPSKPRSASAVATETSVVARLSEAQFSELTNRFPIVWRRLAEELAERVADSNRLVPTTRAETKLFVISSSESLPIARAVEDHFKDEPFKTQVWDRGVFVASSYPIEALEVALDDSDFALAITGADDQTTSRGVTSGAPRDNVLFEAGFFMGRLGRQRTFILKPKGVKLKLPSDLEGLTLLNQLPDEDLPLPDQIAPPCAEIRRLITKLGTRV